MRSLIFTDMSSTGGTGTYIKNLLTIHFQNNIEEIKAMHPLGLGEVSDVVPIIEFLISKNSRWITGQNFIIDGGYSIQ